MFSEGLIGGSNIQAIEVKSLSECWQAQGNADVLKIRQKNSRDSGPVWSLLLHLSRFFTGIYRTARATWCFVAYVSNAREREFFRERESLRRVTRQWVERVTRPSRETVRDNVPGSYYYNAMRIAWHNVYPTIFSCLDPRSSATVGISRRNHGDRISDIVKQRFLDVSSQN